MRERAFRGRPTGGRRGACLKPHFSHSQGPTESPGLLPSHCDVETLDTPNHRPTPVYHHRSRPTHFGPRAGREPDGIHREQPGRGQIASHGSPLLGCATRLPLRQLSDIVGGLNDLHLCDVIHGDLEGVSDYSGSRSTTVLMDNQSDILVDTVGRARITNCGLSGVPQTSTGTAHDGLHW